jgi:endonuclease YncB( thermonuclease family)
LKQSIKNYKDKYNRLLGYIYIPGEEEIFFNKLLIEQGYARAYLRFPFEYSIDFKKAENKAKREKLGMWVHNDVRKQIRELVKQEKKLVNESVRSYKTFKSLDDIQI